MIKRLCLLLVLVLVAAAAPATNPATKPATTTASKIGEFQGPYRFLSNFWPAEVEFEGAKYPSVEHAYQAAKFTDEAMRQRVAQAKTPAEAKSIAHAATTQRANWDQAKFEVMETCVRYKFTHHADLRENLLATGDVELIEGNTWGDRIWGVCDGEGENHLGKILMKVRRELHSAAQDGR